MKQVLFILALFVSGTSFAQKQVQKETTNMINFAAGRIVQLAEAIPEDKFSWAPEEGVRSVSGVLIHVMSGNYFFGTKLGSALPDGINMETLESDMSSKSKAELTAALKKSIEFVTSSIGKVDDAKLGDKVEFPFPGEYTVMSTILIAQGHSNEHLGQLIAYSRMNGITPPWSKQQ